MNEPIFTPSNEMISDSNLFHYMEWVKKNKNLDFNTYEDLWQWSVDEIETFWKSIIEYFDVDIDITNIKVKSDDPMPHTTWFEGASTNYAQYLTRHASSDKISIIECDEADKIREITWQTVLDDATRLQTFLFELGLQPGDRVVAYLPNIHEASIAFLACCASGYIWSICSPDFGDASVIDRFKQIEPKVLIGMDHYQYGGKRFDRSESIKSIVNAIPSIRTLILVRSDSIQKYKSDNLHIKSWDELGYPKGSSLKFNSLPFNHPIWIVYSSGTTGLPKAITHGHGGMLLEHLKYVHFHNDVKLGEKFFWFTTTGWMMWNYLHATWLAGASIVLYNGNPMYPDINKLWNLAEVLGIDHFGTGAPFVHASMKAGKTLPDLNKIKSISSTGSPLSAEAYTWLYDSIHHPFYIWSMSGGTDVATAFVGGCPLRPVYIGEIQCRTLGCDLQVYNDEGITIKNEVGELVITQAMPCMPIYMWNDQDGKKYQEAYFDHFPKVWRHGDWITWTEHDGLVISGRSDTTLKRFGVRIGTAEIYAALLDIPEIEDSLIIHIDQINGEPLMPLFIKMKSGSLLDKSMVDLIKSKIKTHCSPRHVPDKIIQVKDIPFTLSGKKMEAIVKKIFMNKSLDQQTISGTMRNPECLDEYKELRSHMILN